MTAVITVVNDMPQKAVCLPQCASKDRVLALKPKLAHIFTLTLGGYFTLDTAKSSGSSPTLGCLYDPAPTQWSPHDLTSLKLAPMQTRYPERSLSVTECKNERGLSFHFSTRVPSSKYLPPAGLELAL